MGGSSGGGIPIADIGRLEAKAKQSLSSAANDTSPHVFISFSHEDMDEVNLLRGQAKNDKVDLQFDDYSVKEPYNSKNADYIKQQIRKKIAQCSVTIVYLTGKSASSEWVNYEIEESLKQGKGVIGLYKGTAPPTNMPAAFKANNCKSVPWSHEAINSGIEAANKKP